MKGRSKKGTAVHKCKLTPPVTPGARKPAHLGTARRGYVMQVCSRCDGSAVDPEIPDCTCDVCGGTGEEEVPVNYKD